MHNAGLTLAIALAASPPAPGEEATGRDGGERRRAARWAAVTRTRIPQPSRSHAIETRGTGACRCDTLGACARQPVMRVGPCADRRRYQRTVARASAA